MIYKYTAPLIILFLGFAIPKVVLAEEGGTLLKGNVQEQGYLPQHPVAGLKRQDINKGGDAFAGSDSKASPINQEFEPPTGAFEVPTMGMPKPPAKDFNLKANMDENADFNGTSLPAQPDLSTASVTPPEDILKDTSQLKLGDPDSSPEMQLAWDQWHKRVAEAIYLRFNTMSQFAFKYSRPLACYVTYTVTRDGQVTNVQLPRKSTNVAFNAMVLLVIKSISGQKDLLVFPDGSRRMTVDKGGMFTQNYGVQGFKYVTGDRETIRKQP